MSRLLVRPAKGSGHVAAITPQTAGWRYVGFDLFRLNRGEALAVATGGREACLVLIAGKARISAGGQDFGELGQRMSPFDGKPYGAPDRPGGQRVGGQLGAAGSMPAWGQNSGGTLTDQELLDVVCHERITISGEDPTNEQSIAWCTTDGEKYQQVVNEGLAAAGVNVPAG